MRNRIILFFYLIFTFTLKGQTLKIPPFNIKQKEKQFVCVKDSLFASAFECSNLDYKYFLQELKQQGRLEEYNNYAVDSIQWRNLNYFMEPFVIYYHSYPAYHDYPVVNLSQAAAKAYCVWLTEKYNKYKNRKYKKVLFHLPTEDEWILAAKDGKSKSFKRYPVYEFNGMFLNGREGKMQANFMPIDQGCLFYDSNYKPIIKGNNTALGSPDNKGFIYLSKVMSFHPTQLGLYNMAGNAAEMLAEPGRTKGGSWYSVGGYLGINAPDQYKGFTKGSAEIGFRVFMTVIEK